MNIHSNIPAHDNREFDRFCREYYNPILKAYPQIETVVGKWPRSTLIPGFSDFDGRIIASDTIQRLYCCSEVQDDLKMRSYEDSCWRCLQRAMHMLPDYVGIIDMNDGAGFERWKERLDAFPENPLLTIFNGVRFARIRKGRYWCYLNVPDEFDVSWLIPNEFTWLRRWFTRSIFQCYGRLKCDLERFDLDAVLEAMIPGVTDREGADAVREVFRIAWKDYPKGSESEPLRAVMGHFPAYESVLEQLLQDALQLSEDL